MENQSQSPPQNWLSKSPLADFKPSWEVIVFAVIILLAIISRFYDLGARVISHDETSHVYYAWRLFKGMGYSHDPITHGPFQFHFLALVYFLFGDNDYTARIPAAITSLATILFLWKYRRYLGSWGTLAAAFMTLISPFMLYYGRYVRNEAFVALFGVVTIWSILRYLETKSPRFLYWLTAATMLHFTAKETAFIYTAQAMVFLGLVFIADLSKASWNNSYQNFFVIALIVAVLLLGAVFIIQSTIPEMPEELGQTTGMPLQLMVPMVLVAVSLAAALLIAIIGYGWDNLRQLPSFSALLLLGTLVLPQLAAFPIEWAGFDPLDYSNPGMIRTGLFLLGLTVVAVAVGLAWNARVWLICAAIFYLPFTIFYTTVFTNGSGFFTGMVGSLGYWLDQHGVERGSQPWYYYWLIQLPIYEYLPALGGLITLIVGAIQSVLDWFSTGVGIHLPERKPDRAPVFSLLAFWAITSLVAYPIAGEKMPWLTVHIAFPLILLTAWGFQQLMTRFDGRAFKRKNGWLVMILLLILLTSLFSAVGSLLSPTRAFQGQQLFQLRATGSFLSSVFIFLLSGIWLLILLLKWDLGQILIAFVLTGLVVLSALTVHTSFMASFIKYDSPEEYLVYAHGGRGIKEALAQIEEISYRTTDGLALEVAFDNESTYPFWWYLRDYENQRYYAENPTRDLRTAPVILVGNNNYSKLEPVVGNAYYEFTYNRIVWPNQDYFNLTWDRIQNALGSSEMRAAIFQIWLNRDYSKYGEVTGKSFSLASWSPADQMKLYVRKDIANKVWTYGTPDLEIEEIEADPYAGKDLNISPDRILESLNLNTPRNLVVAPDSSLYILNTGNHQVLHVDPSGTILESWGSFSGESQGDGTAPQATFSEPWGIDLGPDGSVYIADTWNHRIQKFTSDGTHILSWGQFGQRESPYSMWGPRDVAVDQDGHVYVTDTGNKRILVYDEEGEFLAEFGEVGLGDGQFDEPSGLALDEEGNLYVADTWNQRIQVFAPDENGIAQVFLRKWDLDAWYGQSLDNKPYLDVGVDGTLFVSDPELSRILRFTLEGEFLNTLGISIDPDQLMDYPTGIAADPEGGVWVADTRNDRVIRFPVNSLE